MVKIKPLIKTHWLGSQNPLSGEMGDIAGVGIDLHASLWISNLQLKSHSFSFSFPGKATPQMFQKPVAEKDFARNQLLKAQLAEVVSEDDLYLKLSQSLLIQTKSGEVLPAILFLKQGNLPAFLNPLFYFEDRGVNWGRMDSEVGLNLKKSLLLSAESPQRKSAEMIFLVIYEILAWGFQRKRQLEDLSVFARSGSQITELHDLLIHQPLGLAASLEEAEKGQSVFGVEVLPHGSALETDLQLFEVSEFADLTQKISEFGERLERDSKFIYKLKISQPQFLPKIFEIATPYFSAQKPIHVQTQECLTREQAQLELSIYDQQGNAHLELSLKNTQNAEPYFPETFKTLGYWFSNLSQTFKFDLPKESQQKPPTGHDYLLFNHHGSTLFTWLEVLNYYLELPLTSGQVIEKSEKTGLELLMKYFKSVMPSLLGKNDSQFNKVFTEMAAQYLEHILKSYLQKLENWRVIQAHPVKGMIDLSAFKKEYLSILRFLILQIFEESQGKLFLRSQFTGKGDLTNTYLQQILQIEETSQRTQWGKFSFSTWEMLFELNDLGVSLKYNDKEITSDTSLDFVFSVKDAVEADGAKSQWFDLHPAIFFNGVKVANDDLHLKLQGQQFGFVEYRGQIYRIDKKQLPTLKTLQRFWRRLQIKSGAGGFKGNQLQTLRLERSRALELLMLRQLGIKVEVTGSWQEVFNYFDSGLGQKSLPISAIAETTLLKHQKDGAQWLWDLYNLRLGAILADEMGLGKTFQVLAFMSSLMDRKELGKSLVIVPTSLLYNWMEEEKKFQLKLPVAVLNGLSSTELQAKLGSEGQGLYLSTYGFLIENTEAFHKVDWNVVVFDEAQALKNITSQRTLAAKKLKARFKVCLTGTPMENNYVEFFSLCDLVVPGCLGDLGTFRREFKSLDVRNDLIRELKLTSKPLLLRRTKKQVELNLPEKVLHQVYLPFETQQKDIYKQMAMTFSRQVEKLIQDQGESKAQISMFSALMRLRQICSDPAAVPGVQYKGVPAKIEHFMNSIEEHIENGESVIVFTQFLATLDRLKKEMTQRKIEHYLLKGSISSQERLRIIGDFNKSENPAVMLMTLKTGGVGLNLTKASIVYHLEPWWNPAVENQATDRAHRMGQTKNVRVFNLLIEGSLEQKISDLKVKKQAAFDKLFSNDEETIEAPVINEPALTQEDFFYLLSEES